MPHTCYLRVCWVWVFFRSMVRYSPLFRTRQLELDFHHMQLKSISFPQCLREKQTNPVQQSSVGPCSLLEPHILPFFPSPTLFQLSQPPGCCWSTVACPTSGPLHWLFPPPEVLFCLIITRLFPAHASGLRSDPDSSEGLPRQASLCFSGSHRTPM